MGDWLVKVASMKTFKSVKIDWYGKRYLTEIVRIENASFDHPWTADEFDKTLSCGNVRAIVAMADDEVVGYALFSNHKRHIFLDSIAVHPEFRRCGIGSQLIGKIVGKLAIDRRCSLFSSVRESNLCGQLFLAGCGLVATKINRNFYDTGEDGYWFELNLSKPATGIDILKNIVEGDGKVLA